MLTVNTQYRDAIMARLLLCCTGHSAKLINGTVDCTVGTNNALYCISCLSDFRIYVDKVCLKCVKALLKLTNTQKHQPLERGLYFSC